MKLLDADTEADTLRGVQPELWISGVKATLVLVDIGGA